MPEHICREVLRGQFRVEVGCTGLNFIQVPYLHEGSTTVVVAIHTYLPTEASQVRSVLRLSRVHGSIT